MRGARASIAGLAKPALGFFLDQGLGFGFGVSGFQFGFGVHGFCFRGYGLDLCRVEPPTGHLSKTPQFCCNNSPDSVIHSTL